jgi:hypothetical protein
MNQHSHTPVLTFFNNKGGVGKPSLVYHLSYMFAEQGFACIGGRFGSVRESRCWALIKSAPSIVMSPLDFGR